MFLAKMSINRPVLTTVIILVFLIFGGMAYFSLNLNQMPDVEIPYVTIQTIYPGAGPKEIEMQISKKIEDAVATVSEIEKIESYSLDGVSIVIIEFQLSKDADIASQEVKSKVDAIINQLPEDAEDPIVEKVDFAAFPIIDVVLSGEASPIELYDIADKTLKDRFSQIGGVARVNITGGQEREIQVRMDDKVVFENSISLPQMLQILGSENMDLPGGYFNIQDQEFTVRVEGEYPDLETMRDLQIPTMFGNKQLGQIATVVDTGKKVRQRAVYFNAKQDYRNANVVSLGIVKSPDGNVVEVADEVRSRLPEIEKTLPEGVKLEIVNDASVFTRSTVEDTISNVVLGVLFTSLILFLFLANIRSTIIVALSMPTSIISTFLLLQAFDLTLNMMTLMGLSVSVGVLVANSVVVLENIFRHKNLGKSPKEASYIGTTEVAVAVIAATLTNLVVFLPIASMTSMVGRFLRELALSASFATIFSIIMSFTLTPMLASLLLPKRATQGKFNKAMENFYRKWDEFYRSILRIILKRRWLSFMVFAGSGVLLVASLVIFGPRLGFEFMPPLDDGKLKVEVELPVGYNLEQTASVLEEIENRIKKYPDVEHILTNLGKKSDIDLGTNMALMSITMVDAKERETGLGEFITKFTKDLSDIPNAQITVARMANMGPGTAPIEFFLLGQDLEVLEKYKNVIMDTLKNTPGLINFDNSSRSGKPEITFFPDRQKLSEAGITVQEVAITMRSAVEGIEATKYREFGNEYDITVTLNKESTNTPEKIGNIPVIASRGPNMGQAFRLAELGSVEFTTGFIKIIHRDKYTAIQFTGSNAEGVPVGNVTNDIEARMAGIDFPAGYSFQWGGSTKMMNEMIIDMFTAIIIAIVLTYLLMAAILESFWQPVLILMTIPLGWIGVVVIMYLTDVSFGITSLMGILMLIGIVVNNAILMLDYTNQLEREEGLDLKKALIEACPVKLKPIIMTSLALILGMLPMAMGIGDAGKEMRIPLGVVSIGGIIASGILTLLVIPAARYFTHEMFQWIKGLFKGKEDRIQNI